jgi:hypothetical protein
MQEMLSKTYTLLLDVILPNLTGIQASQAEQRTQTERLNHHLEEFRAEMQIRLTEIRAEIALCRQELEDTMVTLRESDSAEDSDPPVMKKKRIVN